MLANARMTIDHDMRNKVDVIADRDVRADVAEWANLNA